MKEFSLKLLKFKLKILAKIIIWRFEPKIIAITGSVGKTSAKEAIYAVLKDFYPTRKSVGNLNNELGIPLAIIGDFSEKELKLVSRTQPSGTKRFWKIIFWIKVLLIGIISILRKSSYPKILVLEYAADRPRDIKYLLDIAKPYIGVVTAIGDIPVHVEFFGSPEAVTKEKARLIEILPVNGFAVLNFDNNVVLGLREKTRARVVTFGFSEGADIKIANFDNRIVDERPWGISFKVEYGGSFVPILIKNAFGRAQAYAASVGACVGLIFDLNLVEIAEVILKNYSPPTGRMNLVRGIKDSYLINDTYNASPISVQEAMETMATLPAKRRIAILGDMLELGKYSIEAHEGIGELSVKLVDVLVTVGPRGKFIGESARRNGLPRNRVFSFDTAVEAGKAVQGLIRPGDLILIKASRAIGLEKIVEELKEM